MMGRVRAPIQKKPETPPPPPKQGWTVKGEKERNKAETTRTQDGRWQQVPPSLRITT
jgi:hypothetical protein